MTSKNIKTVLITGASRGIGKAIAIKFAKEGFVNIIITGNQSIAKLNNLKLLLEEAYDCNCLSFIGDIGDYQNAVALYNQIQAKYKGIDILINNAGICHMGLLEDMTIEEWNHIIQTNLTSVFNCSKLAIPHMVRNKSGKIINISSVWGICGASCEVAYSTSKGGINAFTKALGKELAPSNIQVNAIACGVIDTSMNSFLTKEERVSLIEEIPTDRIARPEEVADFVYDLAVGHSYLTSQVIQFDGGFL
ncbi:MAG: SDR family NAD(P)-dependent oxidoreductase [Lachnotalea sp.]